MSTPSGPRRHAQRSVEMTHGPVARRRRGRRRCCRRGSRACRDRRGRPRRNRRRPQSRSKRLRAPLEANQSLRTGLRDRRRDVCDSPPNLDMHRIRSVERVALLLLVQCGRLTFGVRDIRRVRHRFGYEVSPDETDRRARADQRLSWLRSARHAAAATARPAAGGQATVGATSSSVPSAGLPRARSGPGSRSRRRESRSRARWRTS